MPKRSVFIITSLAALGLTACSTPGQTPQAAPVACGDLPVTFKSAGTRLTQVELVPAGLTVNGMAKPYPMPAHCKVIGRVNERVGVDGKPYAIGFEMRLPADWSGRFLLQANGGADGVVVPAFGNVVSAGATTNALMQGFAVLSSDAGHTAESGPAVGLLGGSLFGLDPQARLDYGYQANGALAPMAKKLVATYYGRAPKTSYMMGCSNGGRHAMVAAPPH